MAKSPTIDDPSISLDSDPEPKSADKKPEPKPGDADYDWSAHYGDAELYTHTFADGTVVALKTFGSIYSKTWLYKIRNLQTDTDLQFASIDRAACETAQEVLMSLDDANGDPIEELWNSWISAGTAQAEGEEGLKPGE
ncbi:hypothetical protein R2325_14040 [Mycobacteroides chelonae]|nr:hypothetical protein [Mycobacteroides chelonae]MEC4873146.1 hypothetical protein [Mycobacteroides chelonae]